MIQVLNNVIDLDTQNWLEQRLCDIPFFYYDAQQCDDDVPWFGHYTVMNGNQNSELSELTIDIGTRILHSCGLKPIRYEQVRINMTIIQSSVLHSGKHIDGVKDCDITMLYYINNSDGDTVFYNEDKEICRVSPVKGCAAVFSSNIYHNNYLPNHNKCRAVINYNVKVTN